MRLGTLVALKDSSSNGTLGNGFGEKQGDERAYESNTGSNEQERGVVDALGSHVVTNAKNGHNDVHHGHNGQVCQ